MYSKKDYRFDRIIKSKRATKKYAAVLINRISGRPVKVHFGVHANGTPYDQYYDSALGLYSKHAGLAVPINKKLILVLRIEN